jgi:DNA-binding NarL/FixJ family response regulator
MTRTIAKKEQIQVKRGSPLRTLIVDDSHEFLDRLAKWLSAQPNFEIVGKSYSGFEALLKSRILRPDLVVMDVAMPLMNGYEAAERIKEGAHCPTVILISFFDRREAQGNSELRADAFLLKDSLYKDLLPTVARLFPCSRETAADS